MAAGLFADELNDDLSSARLRIELQEHNLLPGAEHETPVDEWNGDGRTDHRRTDVARSVVVPPPQVMFVGTVARGQLLERPIDIMHDA